MESYWLCLRRQCCRLGGHRNKSAWKVRGLLSTGSYQLAEKEREKDRGRAIDLCNVEEGASLFPNWRYRDYHLDLA